METSVQTRESGPELKSFYYTLCDAVKALTALNRPFDASGDWLVHLVVGKLDPQSRRECETQRGQARVPSTFQDVKSFLEGRVNTIEALEGQRKGPEGRAAKSTGTPKTAKVHQVSKPKGSSELCSLCGAGHFILFCADYKTKSQEIPLADPQFTDGTQIDVLLGADVYSLILEAGLRKGREGEPIAQKTTLGWIISGLATASDHDDPRAARGLVTLKCTTEDDLVPLVRKFSV